MGLFCANWVGVSMVGLAPARPHPDRRRRRRFSRELYRAAIDGSLKAAVGAHEVITTIMLNWIAYWIGNYLFQQGGPLQGEPRTSRSTSRSRRCQRTQREAARLLGRPRISKACTSASSSRSRWLDRLLGDPEPDDAWVRGARGGLQPGRCRLRRNQGADELRPGNGHLQEPLPGWPAGSTCSATCTTSESPTYRPRRSGSWGSRWRSSGATRPSGPGSPRSCSARFSSGRHMGCSRT